LTKLREFVAVGKPKAIDLFSGCGGLTLGLRQAGFRVIGAVECSELAVKTYKKNHRGVHVWQKDIRKLTVAKVMETLHLEAGELDLLAGCPPCQGFSRIPSLNGNKILRDKRNNLVFEFMRFVRVLTSRGLKRITG
jgi:DNA (cytosine-5)-methyltransferase 1